MATAAAKPMTADAFWDWVHLPENRDRTFELERGEIAEMTRPGKLHGFVCANLAFALGSYAVDQGHGYVCTNNTGVLVETDPDTLRGPDLLFFDDAAAAEQIDRKYGVTPPLLAVEVLSPNDSHGRIHRRVREQLAFGTPMVWVVDPESRTVVVYRTGREDRLIEEGEEISGEDVLPDFRCRAADFFAMPGRKPGA